MGLFSYLKSTILSKVVMAVTGIILLLFLIVHVLGNMQLFIGKDSFNTYSHFLHSTGELIWVFRAVMLITLVLHIFTSVKLKFQNLKSKPQKYTVKNYVNAGLTSRTMIWTGIGIFFFVTYHLLHLTLGVINPKDFNSPELYDKDASLYARVDQGNVSYGDKNYILVEDGKILFARPDVYNNVINGFRQPLISLVYILALIILGFHLNHAIQSAIQTLGWNHPKYFPIIQKCCAVFSFLMAAAYISIPITVLMRLVGGGV